MNNQPLNNFEYKVLSQTDGLISGKFSPAQIEKALNSQASQGWRLVTAISADVPNMMGSKREEIVIIMERQRSNT